MLNYYIPYNESIDINYVFVLALYKLAEYNKDTKYYDTIRYSSMVELADRINSLTKSGNITSPSTISRIFRNKRYSYLFEVNTDNKIITLKNDIRNVKKFVMLRNPEVDLILSINENLLAKYILYISYYCGYSKSKETNQTIKQFLAAIGVSTNSNDNISKISSYNTLLSKNGIVKIRKYRGIDGKERNAYSI